MKAEKTKLARTKDVVEMVLNKYPQAKDSDEMLFCYVYQEMGTSWNLPFCQIMKKISNRQLPPLESVRRCRQKLQETKPELRGKNYAKRMDKQEDYIELAKGEI